MKAGLSMIACGVAWLALWRGILILGWDRSAAVLGGTVDLDPIILFQLAALLGTTLTAPTLAPALVLAGVVVAATERRP